MQITGEIQVVYQSNRVSLLMDGMGWKERSCKDGEFLEFSYHLRHDIGKKSNIAEAEPEIAARFHTLRQN